MRSSATYVTPSSKGCSAILNQKKPSSWAAVDSNRARMTQIQPETTPTAEGAIVPGDGMHVMWGHRKHSGPLIPADPTGA
jgi:hypothetical protein